MSPLGHIPRTRGFDGQGEFLAPPGSCLPLRVVHAARAEFAEPVRGQDREKLSGVRAECPAVPSPPPPPSLLVPGLRHLPRGPHRLPWPHGGCHTSSPRWGSAGLHGTQRQTGSCLLHKLKQGGSLHTLGGKLWTSALPVRAG